MDKSEVEMEDTDKEPHDLASSGENKEESGVPAAVAGEVNELSGAAFVNDRISGEKEMDFQPNEKIEAKDHNITEKETEEGSSCAKAAEDQGNNEKVVEKLDSNNNADEMEPCEKGQNPPELSVNECSRAENDEVVDEPKNKSPAKTESADDGGLSDVPEIQNEGDEACTTNETVKPESDVANQLDPTTPHPVAECLVAKAEAQSREKPKNWLIETKMTEDDEAGTPEEQAEFMTEIESFYRNNSLDFKAPKFYGQPLNCLKLWRAVIKLGGYDRVTGSKLWRQVGESFHPPKTCTTVSWTFRIFYEKALLEYERHKRQSGELELPVATLAEPLSVETELLKSGFTSLQLKANGFQTPGSGRARRDAAARAMQGWHVQRLYGLGEVGEPIIKDKNLNNMQKREKNLKSIGSLKQKRPNEVEHPAKVARTDSSKQLATTVVDVGPPADWVKINVRETKDCFEVYALVPGLLREEVRVQSDPAGRLVITGQPEQPDNPWGITAFKKVVSLPSRIDPLQTSAMVSLHGRLFVRVPFEQASV